jgi:hypothetical protein
MGVRIVFYLEKKTVFMYHWFFEEKLDSVKPSLLAGHLYEEPESRPPPFSSSVLADFFYI